MYGSRVLGLEYCVPPNVWQDSSLYRCRDQLTPASASARGDLWPNHWPVCAADPPSAVNPTPLGLGTTAPAAPVAGLRPEALAPAAAAAVEGTVPVGAAGAQLGVPRACLCCQAEKSLTSPFCRAPFMASRIAARMALPTWLAMAGGMKVRARGSSSITTPRSTQPPVRQLALPLARLAPAAALLPAVCACVAFPAACTGPSRAVIADALCCLAWASGMVREGPVCGGATAGDEPPRGCRCPSKSSRRRTRVSSAGAPMNSSFRDSDVSLRRPPVLGSSSYHALERGEEKQNRE